MTFLEFKGYRQYHGALKEMGKLLKGNEPELDPSPRLISDEVKDKLRKASQWLVILVVMFFMLRGCAFAQDCHFSKAEFNQHPPVSLGSFKINPLLITKLEALRKICMNRPIIITSGYRNPAYNLKVGGVKRSQHILGNAADIQVKGISPEMLGNYARIVGFSFVKVYSNHVHVDVR